MRCDKHAARPGRAPRTLRTLRSDRFYELKSAIPNGEDHGGFVGISVCVERNFAGDSLMVLGLCDGLAKSCPVRSSLPA